MLRVGMRRLERHFERGTRVIAQRKRHATDSSQVLEIGVKRMRRRVLSGGSSIDPRPRWIGTVVTSMARNHQAGELSALRYESYKNDFRLIRRKLELA